jgi:hypothetical protein
LKRYAKFSSFIQSRKTTINGIINEKGSIITYKTAAQMFIRDYYKKLYFSNLNNLEEVDTFLLLVFFKQNLDM